MAMRKKHLPEHLQKKRPYKPIPMASLLLEGSVEAFETKCKELFAQYQADEMLERMKVFQQYVEFLGADINDDNLDYLYELAEQEVPAMQSQGRVVGKPARWGAEDGVTLLIDVFKIQFDNPRLSDRSAAKIACKNHGWVVKDAYDALKTAQKHLESLQETLKNVATELKKRGISEFP